jgi:hypothetical protein
MKKNISAYSGKDGEEDVVYASHNQGNVCIAKNYTKPKESPQHLVFKECANAISSLWDEATPAYKNDLKLYAKLLNDNLPTKIKATSFAIFVKILYAFAKSEGALVSTLEMSTLRTSIIKDIQSTMDNKFIARVNSIIPLDKVI